MTALSTLTQVVPFALAFGLVSEATSLTACMLVVTVVPLLVMLPAISRLDRC